MINIKDWLVYKILRETCSWFISTYPRGPSINLNFRIKNVAKDYLYSLCRIIKELTIDSLGNLFYRIKAVIRYHFIEDRLGIKTLVDHNFGYEPTPYHMIERMIEYLPFNSEDIFVDLGCGKGRVILYLSTKNLRKIIGVEVRNDLANIAKHNLKNLKLKNTLVEIIDSDVAIFKIEEGTVFFMNNPFGEKILSKVIKNIKKNLAMNFKKIRIIYYNPVYKNLLDSQDWLVSEGNVNKIPGGTPMIVWRSR